MAHAGEENKENQAPDKDGKGGGRVKKEENTNERGKYTQSENCNCENHMNKSLFTHFYKSETIFGFLFKFSIAD